MTIALLLREPPDPHDHQMMQRAIAQHRAEMIDAALRRVAEQYGPTLFAEKVLWAVRRAERNLPPERVLPAATLRDIRRAFAALNADPELTKKR